MSRIEHPIDSKLPTIIIISATFEPSDAASLVMPFISGNSIKTTTNQRNRTERIIQKPHYERVASIPAVIVFFLPEA